MTKRQTSLGVTEGNRILRHISSEIQSLFFNKIYLMNNIFSLFTKNYLCMYMYIHSTLSMFRSGAYTLITFQIASRRNYRNPLNTPKHFSSDDVKILNFIRYITDFKCDNKLRNKGADGRHGFDIFGEGVIKNSLKFVMILLEPEEV